MSQTNPNLREFREARRRHAARLHMEYREQEKIPGSPRIEEIHKLWKDDRHPVKSHLRYSVLEQDPREWESFAVTEKVLREEVDREKRNFLNRGLENSILTFEEVDRATREFLDEQLTILADLRSDSFWNPERNPGFPTWEEFDEYIYAHPLGMRDDLDITIRKDLKWKTGPMDENSVPEFILDALDLDLPEETEAEGELAWAFEAVLKALAEAGIPKS